jgi:hypothetical protein
MEHEFSLPRPAPLPIAAVRDILMAVKSSDSNGFATEGENAA